MGWRYLVLGEGRGGDGEERYLCVCVCWDLEAGSWDVLSGVEE